MCISPVPVLVCIVYTIHTIHSVYTLYTLYTLYVCILPSVYLVCDDDESE